MRLDQGALAIVGSMFILIGIIMMIHSPEILHIVVSGGACGTAGLVLIGISVSITNDKK